MDTPATAMTDPFLVRFWGVRGSIASGGSSFAGVGGNTSCVEVRVGNQLIILDAGTGVFPLGLTLDQPIRATFLLTHFHWDHIQGFPMFKPVHARSNGFIVYGPGESAAEVRAVFERQMESPFSPKAMAELDAHLEFRSLRSHEEIQVGGACIRTVALNHTQPCLGYRITVGGLSVAFATDTEPPDGQALDPAVVELASGAKLLIHDSQYSEHEYEGLNGKARKGWGHSTYEVACRAAWEAGVDCLALFHHDPSHDDRYVEWMEIGARALFPNTVVAREGMTLEIEQSEPRLVREAVSEAGSTEARDRRQPAAQ